MGKRRRRKRKTRNGISVKRWMLKAGITQADIVISTQVNKGLVSRTVNGFRNCRKVLNYLRENKMPERLLWKKGELKNFN